MPKLFDFGTVGHFSYPCVKILTLSFRLKGSVKNNLVEFGMQKCQVIFDRALNPQIACLRAVTHRQA